MTTPTGSSSQVENVPVLIVGGSIVGLSTAMFLAWYGVRSVSVERHPGTAVHPRAGHFHLRTLELLRSVGLEDEVRSLSAEQFGLDGGINAVESLAGREIARYIDNLNKGVAEVSPSVRLFLTQQRLEPILRARAEELGARLHYATELTSLEQDAHGVTAKVTEVDSGRQRTIRAKYLVAADGNRSPIRENLGIAMRGHGLLSNSATIYFTAPGCGALVRGRNLGVIYVFNEALRGFFRFEQGEESGFLAIFRPGVVPDRAADQVYTEQRCLELVRAAAGMPDLDVRIEDIALWKAVADSADRYQEGRVFIVGDAAHTMPPTGGFGGNTGVQDAQNLAWKLAAVLRGQAGERLLETYDAERRPVGAATVQQAYTRWVLRVEPERGKEGTHALVDEFSAEIGYRYRSSAILSEPDGAWDIYEDPRGAKARPGSRAPHLVLERAEERISTLDLFGRSLVLLTGREGHVWCETAAAEAERRGIQINTYQINASEELISPDRSFVETYGISESGAVLVRPDGFVAWRAHRLDAAAAETFTRVMSTVLHVEMDAD